MKKAILLTGTDCSGCDQIKMLVETRGLTQSVREVDVSSKEGSQLATHYRIRSIPSVIVDDQAYIGTTSCRKGLSSL